MSAAIQFEQPKLVKIDIGCGGKKKSPDHIGLDQYQMEGVDHVLNLGHDFWPLENDSVDEAFCSHFLEHLTNLDGRYERVHFFNQLYRVLKKGAKCELIFPHWASCRFYGDPTHKEPFSEFSFWYLARQWRMENAPHTDASVAGFKLYDCDFDWTFGYNMHHALAAKSDQFRETALLFYKEAAQDIHATLTKK
jgi:hypothetical protein